MKMSNKVVIISLSAVSVFFVAETLLLVFGYEGYPEAMIAAFFSFFGVELAALAGIKISKVRHEDSEEDEEVCEEAEDVTDDDLPTGYECELEEENDGME